MTQTSPRRENDELERDTLEPHRFTVTEYHKMWDSGVFPEGTRTELIDGKVYYTPPMGEEHYGILAVLTTQLSTKLLGKAVPIGQVPVELSDDTEPEPDFIILEFREDYYRKRKGTPAETLFLIEVSKSTLDHDRHKKLPRYAETGIQEVWIINANKNPYQLEVYRRPEGREYASKQTFAVGQAVAPAAFPETLIDWW
jgi:Uma2 family endonuclease